MCTLSIIPKETALIVTMNRDEQRNRHENGELFVGEGKCFPIDAKSGGTWIGVNDYGLSLALLNRYQDQYTQEKMQSRGDIIPLLLSCENLDDIENEIRDMFLTCFNSFDFVAVDNQYLVHAIWNGKSLNISKQILDKPFFITSSSERTVEVINHRQDIFSNFSTQDVNADGILQNLHFQGGNDNNESSILMERERTHTKSITQIMLTDENVKINYWPESALKNGLNEIDEHIIEYFLPFKTKITS